MPEQLSLEMFEKWSRGAVVDEIVSCCREVIATIGLKEAAHQLGVDDSVLAHALDGRGRHALHMKWLPWFIIHAPNDRLITILASLRNRDVVARKELTAEEKLERLERAMAEELGPGARRAIYEKALRNGGTT